MNNNRLCFVRFGMPPIKNSFNFLTKNFENGVSVYEAVERNGHYSVLLPSLKGGACVTLSGCLDKPMFEVEGDIVGFGSEGEPLLRPIYIVKKIIQEKSSEGWA